MRKLLERLPRPRTVRAMLTNCLGIALANDPQPGNC